MSSTTVKSSLFSSWFASPQFLRHVLWLDAASGVATAALQCEFAQALAAPLGLPLDLLQWSGWLLAACVLGIVWVATRPAIPAAAVWLLMGVNTLWVLGCLGLLASGLVAPTLLGEGFLIVQAVAVGVLVELEWIGLRRMAPRDAW